MNLLARSLKAILSLAVGLAVTGIYAPANAQDWADPSYRYRRPLTVTNSLSDSSLPAGEVVALSYIPNYGAFDDKTRTDGKDVRIFYHKRLRQCGCAANRASHGLVGRQGSVHIAECRSARRPPPTEPPKT